MEDAGLASGMHRSNIPSSRRFGMQLSSANFLPAPLSALLELTGLIRGRSQYSQVEEGGEMASGSLGQSLESNRVGDGGAEVSIRIFGGGEPEQVHGVGPAHIRNAADGAASTSQGSPSSLLPIRTAGSESTSGVAISSEASSEGAQTAGPSANTGRDAGSQRYDFQQLARWIEQALPFTILLLMVFIRQHLQGEFSCPFLHVNCPQAFFSESGSVTQQMHNSQYQWTCTICLQHCLLELQVLEGMLLDSDRAST
jgi:hypothetical protein